MAHAWRGRAVQSYCTRVEALRDTFYQEFLPLDIGYHAPTGHSLGSLVTTGDQAAPLRAAPAMERRARAHASKRRGAHKHPRLPLLLQIHPLRSVARRARIGPTRTGLHRRGSARARGKGRERRADHLPHPLPHLAIKRCRRRSFCTHPQRALAGGPRLRPSHPACITHRSLRASLPPPSLRSAHAPPLFRIPGPAGPLVARRSPPAHAPPPLPQVLPSLSSTNSAALGPPPPARTSSPGTLPRDELGCASTRSHPQSAFAISLFPAYESLSGVATASPD